GARDHRAPGQPGRPAGHLLPHPRTLRPGRRPHPRLAARRARRGHPGGEPSQDRKLRPPLDARTTGGGHERHARVAGRLRGSGCADVPL
ncbi:MAG: Beta-ketoadipate enol-lactone hydrolase, partial [uncultured Rubrobacteraceae bacterium]